MNRLNVFLNWGNGQEILIGELAEKDHLIYFQYDPDFIEKSLWLSPYKLPLKIDLFEHKDKAFGPIFGLFDDSLPDGWGLMLMDRYLRGRGYSIEKLSILDRLSFLGSRTMGALCYRPVIEEKTESKDDFDLNSLYNQSRKIIRGQSQTVLRELIQAGGSPGGARPKVLVGVKGNEFISGEGDLPADFEHWIIKFDGINDFPDSGSVEYAYSLMARDCGIEMPETRLFSSGDETFFFGIKRFDRMGNERLHSHSLGNLIHSNFRIPSCDYEMLLRVTLDLTKNQQDLLRAFRQMVFNIYSHNRDDHVKNFTFLMNREGEWSLSPAYDLTYSDGPGGEHSMTVDGEGQSPSITNIYSLGARFGLDKNLISEIINTISSVTSNWSVYAQKAGVTESTKNEIEKKLIKMEP